MTTLSINSGSTLVVDVQDKTTDIKQAIWQQIKKYAMKISVAYDIYEERRALRNLSDEMQKDIGITRNQINNECNRSAMDLPSNRLNAGV